MKTNGRVWSYPTLLLSAIFAFASSVQAANQKLFTAAPFLPVGTFPDYVVVADRNRDSLDDVAVSARAGGVHVLLGKKSGFLPPSFYPAGQLPQGIAVGDFNRDRKLDLFLADSNGNQVDIPLGKGGGTFRSLLIFPAGTDPVYLAVGDLNHDSILDLVFTQSNGSSIAGLLCTIEGACFAHALHGWLHSQCHRDCRLQPR